MVRVHCQTFILRSFIESDVKGCIIAVFNDAAAVAVCASAGVGAEVTLTLNSEEDEPKSEKLMVTGPASAVAKNS